jgi:hypothetical protein
MNKYLAKISTCVSPRATALMTLDGAGWHRSLKVIVPENEYRAVPLPPYARKAVNIREYLRGSARNEHVWDNYEAILDARCAASDALIVVRRHYLNWNQTMGTVQERGWLVSVAAFVVSVFMA